jgi:hypothetical protein
MFYVAHKNRIANFSPESEMLINLTGQRIIDARNVMAIWSEKRTGHVLTADLQGLHDAPYCPLTNQKRALICCPSSEGVVPE